MVAMGEPVRLMAFSSLQLSFIWANVKNAVKSCFDYHRHGLLPLCSDRGWS